MTLEIDEALDKIAKNVKPLATEMIPIEEAVGRVLARDIIATVDLPAFDNSAMDGYAVCIKDAGKSVKSCGTIFAGDKVEDALKASCVMRIMTGSPVPQGCNAIVPIEQVLLEGDLVSLPETIREHQHIRFRGEDIRSGETLLEAGVRLIGYQTALLASQGISHVSVYRRPKVAVFASGEELKMHFESIEPHQIYNSNTPTFLARAKEFGADVVFVGSCHDTLEDIQNHIKSALDADLIVTSGGVSVGDKDFTKEAFEMFGIERLFDKINIKPGKPTTFGRIGSSWVLNLPGNPLAALVNFELFGIKTLLRLSGAQRGSHLVIETHAQEPIDFNPGRVTVIPGYWDGSGFVATKKRSPGMISPLKQANAILIVGAWRQSIAVDEAIQIIPFEGCHSSDIAQSVISQ